MKYKKKVSTYKVSKPKKNSTVFAATKASESKLSQAAMHLEYSFDRGVNFIDRVIRITGEIDEGFFDIVDAAMDEFERDSKKGVTVRIYSGGGSVYEALAIVGRLRKSKCHITTEGYGCIMSAATIILSCGDKRKMSEYATFMHHESSYAVEGRHSQISNFVHHAEREEGLWARWMAEFSDRDEAFWLQFGRHVDRFFFANECAELGVIDEII